MKTILKSLVIAIFFVGVASTSYAQKAATAPASAEILQDLVISLDGTLNAINFGRVSSTTPGAVVLKANSAAANINTGTVTNVAQFDLGGADGGVTVFYDPTVTLTSGGGLTITMTPEVIGSAVEANRATAVPVASGSTVTLVTNAYFLWVGGSLPALTNQGVGTYSGTFNISAEYN
jgi:hypothetical protein